MKRDGECAVSACLRSFDMRKHDKPPEGWAHLIANRYSKKKARSVTYVICPDHTFEFTSRNVNLVERMALATQIEEIVFPVMNGYRDGAKKIALAIVKLIEKASPKQEVNH